LDIFFAYVFFWAVQVCSIGDWITGEIIGSLMVGKWLVVVIATFGGIGLSVRITWTTKWRCKRASQIAERSPENKVYLIELCGFVGLKY
jgi:hypothetical protein